MSGKEKISLKCQKPSALKWIMLEKVMLIRGTEISSERKNNTKFSKIQLYINSISGFKKLL